MIENTPGPLPEPSSPANNRNTRLLAAQGISYLLHPALMPIYTTLILLWGNTLFRFLPENMKLYVLGVVVVTTMLAPMAFLPLLKALRLIESYRLASRSDRILPLLMTSTCYIACTLILQKVIGSTVIYAFLIGTTFITIVATIITYYWRISLHTVGISGVLAILYITTFGGAGNLIPWITLFMVLTGLLASSRLLLGRHNLRQIAAGFVVGFGIMMLWLLIG